MQLNKQLVILTLTAAATLVSTAPQIRAETLTIASAPPGATVEIDGIVVGKTPYQAKFPSGYFHKTKTVFGARLEHAVVARIYKDGYTAQELTLTEGPMEWIALNGKDHGRYWLFKTDQIQVTLQQASKVFSGSIGTTSVSGARVDLRQELPVEQIVDSAGPAVVELRGTDKAGTGFFITETGVIATNAHVASGESTLMVVSHAGGEVAGKVVYVDPNLDLALVKVEGPDSPHLVLADISKVRAGQTVVAIGNPALGMRNTVTKGIVSAVGPDPEGGNGIWIQTDAAINPGNSGGPLLNTYGEVVGINTKKGLVTLSSDHTPLQGIGFALSSADLIQVLHRFYPDASPLVLPSPTPNSATGAVTILSDPQGADIYVDGRFVGQTPSTVPLSAASHHIVVKAGGRKDWERDLEVLKDSQLTLHPVLEQTAQKP